MKGAGGKHALRELDGTTDRLPVLTSLVRVQQLKVAREKRKVEKCHYCVMQMIHPKNEDCAGTRIATTWR